MMKKIAEFKNLDRIILISFLSKAKPCQTLFFHFFKTVLLKNILL